MKNKGLFSCSLFILSIGQCSCAAVGCMEKSWHLKESYDYKSLHYVTNTVDPHDPHAGHCECPCDKYIAQHGKEHHGRCPVCGHYRVPFPVIIVNNALEKYKQYEEKNPVLKTAKNKKIRKHKKNNVKTVMSLFRTLTESPKAISMQQSSKSDQQS